MSERIIKSVSISGSKEEWMEALAASRTPPTSQSDEALVEELAKAICEGGGFHSGNWDHFMDEARALLPILHRVRREGIEEAAKVCLEHDWGGKAYDAIRALAEKQP